MFFGFIYFMKRNKKKIREQNLVLLFSLFIFRQQDLLKSVKLSEPRIIQIRKVALFCNETGSTFLAPTLVQVKFYRNALTVANIPLHTVFNSYHMVWLCDGLRASALHCNHKVMVQNR